MAETDVEMDRVRQGEFIEVRDPGNGKLLFCIAPARGLIEIRNRGQEALIDLTRYGLRFVEGGGQSGRGFA